ncbi:MAG: hypothetical protein WCY18_03015, partial [Methanofastidiosum sp.]
WKNIFEESKSFDIERTTISVKSKLATQTSLPSVPQSITQTIQDIKSSPYAPFILIAIIVLLLSIVGYSVYKSMRSKGPSSTKLSMQKDGTPPTGLETVKKEKIKSKKGFKLFSKQKEKVVKSDRKTPVTFEAQVKSLVKEPKKEKKSFGLFTKKEKTPPKERFPVPVSPNLEAENKFKEFVTRDEGENILTKDRIDQELLGKRVAPPAIKQKQKNKFSLFSKKKEGIPQEKKSFSLDHLYQSQEDKEIKKERLRKEIESVNILEEDLPLLKDKFHNNNGKAEAEYTPLFNPIMEDGTELESLDVEFRPPGEIRKEPEELKLTLQDKDKIESIDSFEIDSLRSEISKTLEEIEKRQENISREERQINVQHNIEQESSRIDLMSRKELDEFQIKILNELDDLEIKKHVDFEEGQLKEIKGRVIPKNVDLDLPPAVENAYKEFRQKKNNGEPENPFKDEGKGSSKKGSSWTNSFKHNNTSPEIPSSIKELLEKRPSSSNDTYTSIPDPKELIKGKKETNTRFFSNNPTSIPDPKEVIKGKKKNQI